MSRKQPGQHLLLWPALLLLFLLVCTAGAFLGAPVPLSDLWSSDAGQRELAWSIFRDVRWPRVAGGALIGASLACSGAALQVIFRNPLAEPYLLGVSAGGALGAALAMALRLPGWGPFEAPALLAMAGSFLAAYTVYRLGQVSTRTGTVTLDRATLLLTGVALSAFLSALMALAVALSSETSDLALRTTFWLLGGLANVTGPQNVVLALCLAAGMGLLLGSARDMNALAVGDEEALALGVATASLHRRLLLAASLMSAAAVAAAGLIGFIGLLAPHIIRLTFGSNARALIPAAAVGGAALLVACDALARTVIAPAELPVGIVTSLLGVPLFLFLVRRPGHRADSGRAEESESS